MKNEQILKTAFEKINLKIFDIEKARKEREIRKEVEKDEVEEKSIEESTQERKDKFFIKADTEKIEEKVSIEAEASKK